MKILLVVLDKPIFYYWLVAASYGRLVFPNGRLVCRRRLPELGCVALVFFFGRRFFGFWEGLWSGLVLVTSLEFYLLARIVIFDMTLDILHDIVVIFIFLRLARRKKPAANIVARLDVRLAWVPPHS